MAHREDLLLGRVPREEPQGPELDQVLGVAALGTPRHGGTGTEQH